MMERLKKIDAELVIFDLDGTLIDSSEDIAWAANMTLKDMGYGELSIEEIKEGVGWGVKPLLEKLMPRESPESIDRARHKFLEFYGGHLTVKTYIYPGVTETIDYLARLPLKMAVVTNKPVKLADEILDELGLKRYFLMVLGGDSLANKKPHPEPVLKVMDELGGAPGKTVLIGDSPIDCETGKGAGIHTIGVTYGFRGREELEGAGCDIIIDDFRELKEILKKRG